MSESTTDHSALLRIEWRRKLCSVALLHGFDCPEHSQQISNNRQLHIALTLEASLPAVIGPDCPQYRISSAFCSGVIPWRALFAVVTGSGGCRAEGRGGRPQHTRRNLSDNWKGIACRGPSCVLAWACNWHPDELETAVETTPSSILC